MELGGKLGRTLTRVSKGTNYMLTYDPFLAAKGKNFLPSSVNPIRIRPALNVLDNSHSWIRDLQLVQ
jgi:hypothetical protein